MDGSGSSRTFLNTDWPDPNLQSPWDEAKARAVQTIVRESKKDKAIINDAFPKYGIGDPERDEQYRAEGYEDYYSYGLSEGGEPFPTIITQFGTWAVTHNGLQSLTESYDIPASDLDMKHWVEHMAEKNWVDMEDFTRALYHARKIHRYLRWLRSR